MSQQSSSMVKKVVKYILMTIGLGIVGVLFGVVVVLIFYFIAGDSLGPGAAMVGIIGFTIGYPIGVIVGTVSINKIFHQRGSLLFGILGSIFGMVFVLFAASPLNLYNSLYLGYPMFFLSAPVFCLVGFYFGSRIPNIWKRDK